MYLGVKHAAATFSFQLYEEKLERLLTNPPRKLSRSVVLALRKNYGNRRSKRQQNGDEENVATDNCQSIQADIENNHL